MIPRQFKYLLVVITFFMIVRPAVSQITHRNLLEKYLLPADGSGLVKQADWHPFPQSTEEWRKDLPDGIYKGIIKRGEDALKKEFKPITATEALAFVRTGNRVDYERQSFLKRNMLWDMVLAEAAEGKGRFTDHIVDGVWSICEESYWGLPVHLTAQKAGVGLPDVEDPTVDLFAAETAAVLAWTDYFVGDKLNKVSPLIRRRIYQEVDRRIFSPMDTAKYAWMGNGNSEAKLNNWAPWIISNYLTAALLLEKNTIRRVDAVNRSIRITDQYINGLGDDGGCDEGPLYWFAAGASAFDVLNLLNDASNGKINIYNEPFVKKIGAYIYKTHIGGKYFINVADAHPKLEIDGVMIYRFGNLIHDEQMMRFGSWAVYDSPLHESEVELFRRTRRLYNLFNAAEIKKYSESYHDPADVWFNDVQLMAARSDKGLFVAAHGGNNGESHNHNDVGDFCVYADNEPVIIDVGSGTYTARTFSKERYSLWFNTSLYHNLPVINGKGQKDGLSFAASNVNYKAGTDKSRLSMDIKGAYPPDAGIKYWIRTVELDRPGKVVIRDSYELNAAGGYITQTLMTICDADIASPGTIYFTTAKGKKVQLIYNAGFWKVKKEKVPLTSPEDQGLKSSWDHRDIYRLLLVNKNPVPQKAMLTYIISK